MTSKQVTIDLTHAKSVLFVRQTVALAFGMQINGELTWEILRDRLYDPENRSLPAKIVVTGLPNLGVSVPSEAKALRSVLRELGALRPEIAISILLHS
ncbi:hypothetical protein [Lysobacter sp. Root604]|uniref:hypothetical protein n=1 Tax=Lysobacter sp. Root604 TaxID=1736568 RepID=UPI0012F75AD8|nr:hypothetical protein [Lysobacter sp. Root604]